MRSTTLEEESKFLASVAVASPTQSVVVDYSEETQASNPTNRSSSYPTAAMLQPVAAMVAMAAINLSLKEDKLVRVKAPWEVEA